MNIFIIDDDHLSIFLTKTLLSLEDATHQIKTYSSGTEALAALKSGGDEVPDLILLDLNMPIMDGWDFLNELEPLQEKLHDNCTIHILTSSLDTSDTVRSKDYPLVAGLIYKPITTEDIRLITSEHQSMASDSSKEHF